MTRTARRTGLALAAAVALALAAAVLLREGGREPVRHELAMRAFGFEPAVVEVHEGDTLVWTNHDIVPHTVTSKEAGWDSGVIPPGASWTLVASGHGSVPFACIYHPTMKGTLTVS
ncbi:MAG TPA: cupredoxin domain-containing protein [Longimicrobiales bacterium]|nr:cupredoxin domain-containing protein [Longimicrobiales bacterium]